MLRIPHGRLIALRAPQPLDPNAEPPTKLVILKWGDNATTKGNFRVGPKTLASLAANQRAAGFDEVVLDFEHNTLPGHPSHKGEPATIAARGKPNVIEGEGLVFESLSWTEPGKQFLENYHDVSGAVAKDANDDVVFVHSAALCRNGATYDLHAFNAQLDFNTMALTTVAEQSDAVIPVNKNAVDLDLLRKILNLSADATVEDINRAILSLNATPGADATELSADAMALIRALTAKVNGFESRFVDSERQAIVLEALNAGKVIPQEFLEGELRLDNPRLKALVVTLPEIVPLDQRTPERLTQFASELRSVNPVQKQICEQLGISEENLRKYGGTAFVTQ